MPKWGSAGADILKYTKEKMKGENERSAKLQTKKIILVWQFNKGV